LYAEITANGGNTSLPVTGIPSGGAWHYSGFYADMLPSVMSIAGVAQYTLTFYPTYTSLLYAVAKSNDCDVGWAAFTNTAQRAWCSNTSHSMLQTPACIDPKPGEKPAGHHACCAHFGVPTQQVSLGLLISGNANSANLMDLLANYQVVNIIGLMAFAVIAAAHIVWYLEREENSEQFPRNYMDGIDDAIWWACTTVTTVGYGDKYPITALGRTFGLLWMFVGVAFLGLFAGTISGAIDSASSSIHTPYDVSPTQKVCIPLELYSNEAKSLNYGFNSYINENGGVNGCVADLLAGKCEKCFCLLFSFVSCMLCVVCCVYGTGTPVLGNVKNVFVYCSPFSFVSCMLCVVFVCTVPRYSSEFIYSTPNRRRGVLRRTDLVEYIGNGFTYPSFAERFQSCRRCQKLISWAGLFFTKQCNLHHFEFCIFIVCQSRNVQGQPEQILWQFVVQRTFDQFTHTGLGVGCTCLDLHVCVFDCPSFR